MVNLSIVIPVRNEEDCLESTVKEIIKFVDIANYEILICNDYSIDNTVNIALKLKNKYKQIRIIHNETNSGFGNIVKFGFEHARGKYVVLMMADLCDDPKTINDMYTCIKDDFVDCVVGSRYMEGGNKYNIQNKFKSFCSWFVGFLSYYALGIHTHDASNAFKMVKRRVLDDIRLTSNDFDISFELTIKLWQSDYRITEIPTIWIDRSVGKSKFTVTQVALKYIRWFFI